MEEQKLGKILTLENSDSCNIVPNFHKMFPAFFVKFLCDNSSTETEFTSLPLESGHGCGIHLS